MNNTCVRISQATSDDSANSNGAVGDETLVNMSNAIIGNARVPVEI
jgi:hypothetical protein